VLSNRLTLTLSLSDSRHLSSFSLFAIIVEFVSTGAIHRSHHISPQFLLHPALPWPYALFELVSARTSHLSCLHYTVSLTDEQSIAASTLADNSLCHHASASAK
jgi:hypothetical protein